MARNGSGGSQPTARNPHPRGATCLDLAAGIGWASVELARRDPSARIVALDYDGAILPRTRDYLDSHAAAHAALCRADGKHLPFRGGSFDLVLCLYGLHHFRGYFEALREIARVLKPGGTFALIDPIRKVGKPPGGHHGMEVLAIEELVWMLGEAGFELVAPRISLGRAKAVIHKSRELRSPDSQLPLDHRNYMRSSDGRGQILPAARRFGPTSSLGY